MRLIEEKILIIIEVILLIGISLSSIFYEISKSNIDNYNYELLKKQTIVVSLQNQQTQFRADISNIKFDIINKIDNIKRLGGRTDYADDEIYEIRKKFFNGSINQKELYDLEYEYLIRKDDETTRKFNIANQNWKSALENRPLCFWKFDCNNMLSILRILQTFFIILGLIGYIYLITLVSKRE